MQEHAVHVEVSDARALGFLRLDVVFCADVVCRSLRFAVVSRVLTGSLDFAKVRLLVRVAVFRVRMVGVALVVPVTQMAFTLVPVCVMVSVVSYPVRVAVVRAAVTCFPVVVKLH